MFYFIGYTPLQFRGKLFTVLHLFDNFRYFPDLDYEIGFKIKDDIIISITLYSSPGARDIHKPAVSQNIKLHT